MAKSENDHGPRPEPWKKKVDDLLARRKVNPALRLLDMVINNRQALLFDDGSWLAGQRRLAWLYRIDILRGVGRFHEALAWACLECELEPENIAAKALRNRLKKQLFPPEADRGNPAPQSDPWGGVAGMRDLKAMLERDVLLPLQEPELYRQYRVALPNGIMLHGPPGCGKTFIARKLAEALTFHFIEVKPSDLANIYVHGTQEKISKLFADARAHAPCVLFLDEIDAILPARSPELYHSYAAEVNELLAQINEASKSRLLIIGATNRLDKIDLAALRPGRFDKKVLVGPPDIEARADLLRLCLKDRPQDQIEIISVARESAGYSCAELTFIVDEAARRALAKRRPISTQDLMAELAANPSTTTADGKA